MPLNKISSNLQHHQPKLNRPAPSTTRPSSNATAAQATASRTTPRVAVTDGFDHPTQSASGFASRDGVPVFNQGDPRWGSRQLGTASNGTIRNRGCAITSAAMAVSKLSGRTITPAQMDSYLDSTHSYAGNSVMFDRVGNIAGISAQRQRGMSVSAINNELSAGRPVLIGVDYKNGPGTDHWMAVTGRNANGTYNVNDPNGGREIQMTAQNGTLVGRSPHGQLYRYDGDAVTFRG